jgi:hypothetical protein
MIIARKTNARTRSWTIGGVSFWAVFSRLGVMMYPVTKRGHPHFRVEIYNLGGMLLAGGVGLGYFAAASRMAAERLRASAKGAS